MSYFAKQGKAAAYKDYEHDAVDLNDNPRARSTKIKGGGMWNGALGNLFWHGAMIFTLYV